MRQSYHYRRLTKIIVFKCLFSYIICTRKHGETLLEDNRQSVRLDIAKFGQFGRWTLDFSFLVRLHQTKARRNAGFSFAYAASRLMLSKINFTITKELLHVNVAFLRPMQHKISLCHGLWFKHAHTNIPLLQNISKGIFVSMLSVGVT